MAEQSQTEAPPPPAPPTPLERLAQAVGSIPGITGWRIEKGELVADAERGEILAIMTTLRDDPRFAFEQMMDVCGVDWLEREERFDVVYNLLSVSLNQRVRVICTASETTPVPSVHTVWPAATWWEREAWDLYGIIFDGQPDLRRILTDYGFEGHPMRKDFPLTGYTEVRYDEDRKAVIYEPVKLTQDWRSFDFLSPWEGMTTLPGDEKVYSERRAKPADAPAPQGNLGPGQAAPANITQVAAPQAAQGKTTQVAPAAGQAAATAVGQEKAAPPAKGQSNAAPPAQGKSS